MKKRILSILLTLCMVLMLCPATAFAEGGCTITYNFKYGTYQFGGVKAETSPYSLSESVGDKFTLGTVVDCAPYKFVGWKETGSGTVYAPCSDTMATSNLTFEAVYEVDGSLAITIDGADVVCAEQDYEFSVTPSEGVTLDEKFAHDSGYSGSDIELTIDEDGVVPAAYYEPAANGFDVNAHGTTADGTPVSTTKHVEVSPEHIYVDGVCGCGAVQQYTITYDEDRDVTLYPYWEKLITLTVPYTTTVALGDVGVPGEKTFTLALIGDSAPDKDKSNVTVSGSVTTNGKGSYNGTLTITGPEETLWAMLSEGAFVQQVDDGEAGWTVDDTVRGVLMDEIPVAYATGDDAVASKYTVYAVPASIDGQGNYTIDWENLQTADMAFTNTYTAHAYELKHDADGHWDECAGCGDK